MSRIRGKNTKPEVELRRALFALGIRYRLHSKNIQGRPDIVFPRYRIAVFVNGCFWHGHHCSLFKWPSGNAAFWRAKIHRNRRRDLWVNEQLVQAGWRTITVWECAIRRAPAARIEAVAKAIVQLLGQQKSEWTSHTIAAKDMSAPTDSSE